MTSRSSLAVFGLPLLLGFSAPVFAEPSGPVSVRLAASAAPREARMIAATVAPVNRATISTRMAATVQRVLVNEGKPVKRGQLLLLLSAEDVKAQLTAASTALENATAYERRISELTAKHAATQVELESAQAQRAQAAAAVAAAQANLGYTQLRAPFDGTVQARRVNAGDFVGPGQPLVDVEGSALELQATLSEEEARGLSVRQQMRFESNGHDGLAEVTALTPGGDALSHRRTLRAKVVSGLAELRSGAFARIAVPGTTRSAQIRVPQTALVQRGDLTGVFVAEDGRARLRWLSVGEVSGGEVLIRAGLAEGDAVIDSPGSLRDEQPVAVVEGARP